MIPHPFATRFLVEIELLALKEKCLLWAMDNTFSHEIFVSSTFKTYWHREVGDMYRNRNAEEMATYVNSFIHEKCFDKLQKRLINPKNTIIYQIKLPDNKLQLVQDRSFPLNDKHGNCLLIAGVVVFLSDEELDAGYEELISDKMDKICLEYHRLLSIPCEKVIPKLNDPMNRLSDKQRSIFKYILHGMNAKEIAKKMHLSARTIEFHTNKIKEIFQVGSKSELISFAIRENLMGIFF